MQHQFTQFGYDWKIVQAVLKKMPALRVLEKGDSQITFEAPDEMVQAQYVGAYAEEAQRWANIQVLDEHPGMPFLGQLLQRVSTLEKELKELRRKVQINEDSLAAVKHWQTAYEDQHNY